MFSVSDLCQWVIDDGLFQFADAALHPHDHLVIAEYLYRADNFPIVITHRRCANQHGNAEPIRMT